MLAYSGGLDTSVILKWLQDTYGCEVVTFTADIGQGEELEPARRKAKLFGVKKIFIDDLREEFVRDFVFPMFRANAVYEGEYLLGTSIARPLIAKHQIEIARMTGADAISHGATGKGNDQVRFELGDYALDAQHPGHRALARMGSAVAREAAQVRREARHPGGLQEEERRRLALHHGRQPAAHFLRRRHPRGSGQRARGIHVAHHRVAGEGAGPPEYVELDYERGDIVAVNGKRLSPAKVLAELNRLGGKHGIGRLDLVENRYVGMKSRGCYETPGGTIMLRAHRAIESITLDREVARAQGRPDAALCALIYNGYWFSPERRLLQTLIDDSQRTVNGTVRVKLYKGTVMVVGRDSKTDSLFDPAISTFEDDRGAYDQADAEGFIRLNALRMRIAANLRRKKR